ncbi:MAG: hypothetical protein ACD_32C00012G0012 [uncultured bacterium]|nr:MAG: hypothetical protein ACD_32C00012G0012 [uncultured bacterium]OGE21357.1 MAG: hypothetical protein A2778_04285 [Candidatus Daviesbacteria bacterium RIFCSPHIGHO2_01_FULL_40_24]OGE30125.1 MAG: hypothetical protein A3C29_01835 [Candidatus Daviesbacteria bacterium RIFCSPHIGHO2_02_FULL_40_16]OGE43439.1 MAG: hypothetical protein A3A53_02275 [Candidatus Daviesbacteria bacterium RIFCSPLOWO2_01_FULL_39_23]OGE67712.1 MAG: hypothetical protein A3J16_02155 [Candidatus Daviesbacteria bacterium RIFCSP
MSRYNQNKQIIILRHNGGQLGNQLLLFTSVYAYCLEKNYMCINPSFYAYNKHFNFSAPGFFSKLFSSLSKFKFYKSHATFYILYRFFTHAITFFQNGLIVKDDPKNIFFLPPSPDKNRNHNHILKQIELEKNRVYLDGWAFRNPVGLKKYRKQLIKAFQPKEAIVKKTENFIKQIGGKNNLIGVHIRQGDYKSKDFMNGTWYFNEEEVANILRAYLEKRHKDPKKTVFVICSDGPLSLHPFKGLNIKLGIGSMIEDLLTLSMCNEIIGSNSTFGSLAAYLGNIPFFVFDRQKKYIRGEGDHLFP